MTVRMERHLTWLVLWVLLALPAGCKEQPKPQPPPPPKVTVAQPVQQAVTDSLDLTGNTQAIYTVQLVARVVGYLEKVLFQDGQRVTKGQPLFVIQQNTYEDNLRQAEAAVLQYRAQVQWTESQLTRYSNLIQHNAAARSDVENWRFQRDTAAANLPRRGGAARPGQAQPGLHPGHRPVRWSDGSTTGGRRQSRRIGRQQHGPGPDQPDRPDLRLLQHQRSRPGAVAQGHARNPRHHGRAEVAGPRRAAE